MKIKKQKNFKNGSVYCLELEDGMLIETTDTFLPFYTKDAIGLSKMISHYWKLTKPGQAMSEAHPKGSYFNEVKTHPDNVLPTIRANGLPYDYEIERTLFDDETKMAGTYPLDYDFVKNRVEYLIGMSVPPVMTANVATEIYTQWLAKPNREGNF